MIPIHIRTCVFHMSSLRSSINLQSGSGMIAPIQNYSGNPDMNKCDNHMTIYPAITLTKHLNSNSLIRFPDKFVVNLYRIAPFDPVWGIMMLLRQLYETGLSVPTDSLELLECWSVFSNDWLIQFCFHFNVSPRIDVFIRYRVLQINKSS